MINFEDFILGLKVKLLSKVLDTDFQHPWKRILLNQFKSSDYPIISIEAGAVKANRTFCKKSSRMLLKLETANC